MTLPKYVRRKRAKGRDYYYFDAGKTPTGKRDLISLPHIKDPGFGGALTRAKATRTNRKNHQGILTLDGLIGLYEKSPEFHGLSAASKRSYTLYLARANELIRDRHGNSPPARAIERKDVLALRDALAATPGAASQAIRAIGALYAWAIDNEKAKDNPAKGVKKFQATPHERWPDDLLEEGLADPQVGLAVALFYFTGQRINEVVKMSWRDVSGDFMRVYVQKTKRHIEVAINPELAARLDKLERPAVTILTNANGQPWTQSGLRQKLQAWAKGHGAAVVPHGLRKNAVISLLKAGCTTAEVHGITDQSIQMIEHYAKGMSGLPLGRAAVIKLDAARRAKNNA
jgi:integrase